ncbi:MAG: hypothetical protein JXR07_06450 [Reichenbachiella sp.]
MKYITTQLKNVIARKEAISSIPLRTLLLVLIFIAASQLATAQGVAINTDNSDPDGSAILDVKSTSQGVIFPRMTITERNAIATPIEGLMIYQTDNTPGLRIYNGTNWNLLNPAVAFVKDIKTSNTSGGTPGAGWIVRDLNTTEGSAFLTLNTNQITLESGEYIVEAFVPGYNNIDQHRAKLYNVSSTTDQILGTSEVSNGNTSADETSNKSLIFGIVNIATNTTFEIQHIVTSSSTNGFGLGSATIPEQEVYTVVKITKIAD